MESITRSDQVQGPFTLICDGSCDGGMEFETPEAALAAGWTEIVYDPDGLSWNYLGTCPNCAKQN